MAPLLCHSEERTTKNLRCWFIARTGVVTEHAIGGSTLDSSLRSE